MDIARQLEQKHPQLFEPLIFSFQESRPNTVFYRKLKQIIENLLSTDGDIIQMSVDGHDSQSIASQFKCTEMEVEAILTKYNQKNITSAISIAASNLQNKKLI